MTSNELNSAVLVWSELFKDDDLAIVKAAVISLIQTLEFPPSIADVRKEMQKLAGAVSNEDLAVDEWNAIKKAIGNSIYNAGEMYETLPENAKRFVGSPQQLRTWALSEDFNAEVVRGQFLKQYEVLNERKKYQAMLNSNPALKEIISHIGEPKLLETKE